MKNYHYLTLFILFWHLLPHCPLFQPLSAMTGPPCATPSRVQKYIYFFSSIPHLTGSYRILPHPTAFYRFLPIGVPFSAR